MVNKRVVPTLDIQTTEKSIIYHVFFIFFLMKKNNVHYKFATRYATGPFMCVEGFQIKTAQNSYINFRFVFVCM